MNEFDNNRHELRDRVKKHRVLIGALMVAGVIVAVSDSQHDEDTLAKTPEVVKLNCGLDEKGNEILLTLDEINAMSSPPPVCIAPKSTGFIISAGINPESHPTPARDNAKE